MNKQTLVSQVAKRTGLSKASVGRVVDEAMGAIVITVARGQRVTLSGFGSFERRRRAPRVGRNPHSGEAVPIPATSVPSFRPGDAFREAVLPKRRPRKRPARRSARRR